MIIFIWITYFIGVLCWIKLCFFVGIVMEEEKVRAFLKMSGYTFVGGDVGEKIKNMCIAKMCRVIGIDCEQCYNSKLFQIFGGILGEAVCRKLMLSLHVVSEELRYLCFNGINFVEQSVHFLNEFEVDEAVLDIFNFVDEHKSILLSAYMSW